MAAFVEFHHKHRKVILNLDQVCAIEERSDSPDVLVRCSNAEDYLIVGDEGQKILAAVRSQAFTDR